LELSERRGGWVENAVFALDRAVRRRAGIYEYSSDARCIFRIHRDHAEHSMSLKDGAQICRGDPILKIHIWNEHMPSMGDRGPSVAWARQVCRAMDISFSELARYLEAQSDLKDVKAICADMCLGTSARRLQLARIVARFGFEGASYGVGQPSLPDQVTRNIMMFLLVLVTNPSTLRGAILLRSHQLFFLSREALLLRYARGAQHTAQEAQRPCVAVGASPDRGRHGRAAREPADDTQADCAARGLTSL
jgi:hypothetical protein